MAGGTSTPFGFRPYRHLSGGNMSRTNEFPIASGYNTNIGTGDPVALISDGTITAAAAGARLLGIFQGVSYKDSAGNVIFSQYWTAGTAATEIKAAVADDPQITFEVQSDKASAPVQTDVGLLANHVLGTVDTTIGLSKSTLAATQTTADAGFRILKLVDKPDNTGGQYDTVEVVIFEHEYSKDRPATPGV